MKKLLAIGLIGFALTGCSSMPSEVFTGGNTDRPSDKCGYIGCATGGLVHYPHEEFSASRQPRRWYCGYAEYGQGSSAFHPSDPKHHELKAKEAQCLRALGLDPQGRPLYQN